MRVPRAARANSIVRSPVHELPPRGADRVRGQMHPYPDDQTEHQAARSLAGALWRKSIAPGTDQWIQGCQQVHAFGRVSPIPNGLLAGGCFAQRLDARRPALRTVEAERPRVSKLRPYELFHPAD